MLSMTKSKPNFKTAVLQMKPRFPLLLAAGIVLGCISLSSQVMQVHQDKTYFLNSVHVEGEKEVYTIRLFRQARQRFPLCKIF